VHRSTWGSPHHHRQRRKYARRGHGQGLRRIGDWLLKASNDGAQWEVLDSRSNETFPARKQSLTFTFDNDVPYRIYRLEITSNLNPPTANSTQLAEIVFGAVVDRCPDDPHKTEPGLCGCGTPEGTCDTVTVDRIDSDDLRIGVYNVMRSSVFPESDGSDGGRPGRIAGFERLANAVDVDIWALQELLYDGNYNNRTAAGVRDQSVLDAHGLQRLDVALDYHDFPPPEGYRVHCDHFPLFVDLHPNQ
jgi:hypothetical protein